MGNSAEAATILFADANESALRTMKRAQELGHRTIFIHSDSFQMYPKIEWTEETIGRVDRLVTLPITSDANLLTGALKEIIQREPVHAVVAQLEASIEATAIACDRLAIPFTSRAGVLNARNKARARDLLEAAGLASAQHGVAQDIGGALNMAERIGYPVIAKPTSGTDSLLAFRADTPDHLRDAAAAILAAPPGLPEQIREQMNRGVLIEEHLRGDLISAEIALLKGRSYRLLLCGRSRGLTNECVEMGAALPGNISERDAGQSYAYAEAACRAVGLDFGVFHVELILTSRGPILVELNPRPMGGIMTTMYFQLTGVEFSDYILDTYLQRPPTVTHVPAGRTITARKVIPRQDGSLADQIDLGWLEGLDRRLLSVHNYAIRPGNAVRAGQVLARYVVLDQSWSSTMAFADSLLDRFEQSIGHPIHHSIPAS